MTEPEREKNDERIRELLKSAVPPLRQAELESDLWPAMLRRLEERPGVLGRVAWLDWGLAAAAVAAFVFFPAVIPALLYQL